MHHELNLKSILLLSLLCIFSTGFSQCKDWNWPSDKKTAEEKVALLQDAMAAKKYRQAIKHLNWFLLHAPKINYSIYVHGCTAYDELATREKDPARKKKLVDSLMIMYDLRIHQCGQLESVLNRKALSAFKFFINTNEAPRVLKLMDSVFALNSHDISDGILLPYIQTIVMVQSKFKTLHDAEIMNRYETLTKVVAEKRELAKSKPTNQQKLEKINKDSEEWLLKVVKPDCQFVKNHLVPRFRQNPDDLSTAKRIFSYMLTDKCTDDPIWLEAGEKIFASVKDYGIGKLLALTYLAAKNGTKAEYYLTEVLPLAPTRKDSSEIYFYKGALEAERQEKKSARSYFLEALKLDPSRIQAYERIGDLYYGSFDDCAQRVRQADDRAVYLAAYDYYAKANIPTKMSMSKSQFPSREEVFVLNYKVGDRIKVGCWINEEVVIRTRD